MSQQNFADPAGVYVKKPKADVYTGMLLVALVALAIGILMLCKEMDRYDWKFRRGDVPQPPPPVSQAAPVGTLHVLV